MNPQELREWFEQVARAISEDGSNDDEHDLLIEVADRVGEALGLHFEWDDEGNARVVEDES